MARRHLAHQPDGHTLQATALVHEAYLRLCRPGASPYQGRDHFMAVAAVAMRTVVVDHARRKAAGKRSAAGGRVELDALVREYEDRAGDLLELDQALARLAEADPLLAQLVELRFFGGQPMEECARVLGLSERQAYRWWQAARAVLRQELKP